MSRRKQAGRLLHIMLGIVAVGSFVLVWETLGPRRALDNLVLPSIILGLGFVVAVLQWLMGADQTRTEPAPDEPAPGDS